LNYQNNNIDYKKFTNDEKNGFNDNMKMNLISNNNKLIYEKHFDDLNNNNLNINNNNNNYIPNKQIINNNMNNIKYEGINKEKINDNKNNNNI
jgi:hypothetical protein